MVDESRPAEDVHCRGSGGVGLAERLTRIRGIRGESLHGPLEAVVAGGIHAGGQGEAERKIIYVAGRGRGSVGDGLGVAVVAVVAAVGETRRAVCCLVGEEAGVGFGDNWIAIVVVDLANVAAEDLPQVFIQQVAALAVVDVAGGRQHASNGNE